MTFSRWTTTPFSRIDLIAGTDLRITSPFPPHVDFFMPRLLNRTTWPCEVCAVEPTRCSSNHFCAACRSAGMSSRFVPHLKRWRKMDRSCPHVIHRDGIPMNSVRKAWANSREDAGLGGHVVPHTLRHTTASWGIQNVRDGPGAAIYGGFSGNVPKDAAENLRSPESGPSKSGFRCHFPPPKGLIRLASGRTRHGLQENCYISH